MKRKKVLKDVIISDDVNDEQDEDEISRKEDPELYQFRKIAMQAGYDPDDPLDHEMLIEQEKMKTDKLLKRSCENQINKECFKEMFIRA